MSTARINRTYNCKQTQLYAVTVSFIGSLTDYLPLFAEHNTTYTPAFITALQAQLAQARALPNFQQRNEISETHRLHLKSSADKSLNMWRRLRTYIQTGFMRELHKPKLEAAGRTYFRQSMKNNWKELDELLKSANAFIQAHPSELLAAGMPPAFPAQFQTQYDNYLTLYNHHTPNQLNQRTLTAQKTVVNNQLHATLMRISADAKVIFFDEVAIRQCFTFTRVLAVITATGPAELTGTIKDQRGKPISEVTVTIPALSTEISTNTQGNFTTGRIPSGTYQITCTKNGFQSQTLTIPINKGVSKNIEVILHSG